MPPGRLGRVNQASASAEAELRAGWVLDLQIAACAWAHGHTVATDNRRDFDAISDLVAALYPSEAWVTADLALLRLYTRMKMRKS